MCTRLRTVAAVAAAVAAAIRRTVQNLKHIKGVRFFACLSARAHAVMADNLALGRATELLYPLPSSFYVFFFKRTNAESKHVCVCAQIIPSI